MNLQHLDINQTSVDEFRERFVDIKCKMISITSDTSVNYQPIILALVSTVSVESQQSQQRLSNLVVSIHAWSMQWLNSVNNYMDQAFVSVSEQYKFSLSSISLQFCFSPGSFSIKVETIWFPCSVPGRRQMRAPGKFHPSTFISFNQ